MVKMLLVSVKRLSILTVNLILVLNVTLPRMLIML